MCAKNRGDARCVCTSNTIKIYNFNYRNYRTNDDDTTTYTFFLFSLTFSFIRVCKFQFQHETYSSLLLDICCMYVSTDSETLYVYFFGGAPHERMTVLAVLLQSSAFNYNTCYIYAMNDEEFEKAREEERENMYETRKELL